MKSRLLGAVYGCAVTFVSMSAGAALITDLGGLAVYDTDLDITWLADANLGAGSTFDDGLSATDGRMSWANAMAWAASLTVGGFMDWRLPSMDVNGDGAVVFCNGGGIANCADNELGHLYWEEGITGAAPGPFNQLQGSISGGFYWSSTEFAPAPFDAWLFDFYGGDQAQDLKGVANSFAWAVHDGDPFAVVPIPPALYLFGSGLVGLIGLSKRKKAA